MSQKQFPVDDLSQGLNRLSESLSSVTDKDLKASAQAASEAANNLRNKVSR